VRGGTNYIHLSCAKQPLAFTFRLQPTIPFTRIFKYRSRTMANSSPALLLNNEISNTGLNDTQAVNSVVVHPLVLLSVLDHHTRRQESSGRVIGTLLGRRDGDKVSSIIYIFIGLYQSGQVNNLMLSRSIFSSSLTKPTVILTNSLHLCYHSKSRLKSQIALQYHMWKEEMRK